MTRKRAKNVKHCLLQSSIKRSVSSGKLLQPTAAVSGSQASEPLFKPLQSSRQSCSRICYPNRWHSCHDVLHLHECAPKSANMINPTPQELLGILPTGESEFACFLPMRSVRAETTGMRSRRTGGSDQPLRAKRGVSGFQTKARRPQWKGGRYRNNHDTSTMPLPCTIKFKKYPVACGGVEAREDR